MWFKVGAAVVIFTLIMGIYSISETKESMDWVMKTEQRILKK